jgi:hypothetical protein
MTYRGKIKKCDFGSSDEIGISTKMQCTPALVRQNTAKYSDQNVNEQ